MRFSPNRKTRAFCLRRKSSKTSKLSFISYPICLGYFVSFFLYRLINWVFLYHLMSMFYQKFTNLEFGFDAIDTKFKRFAIFGENLPPTLNFSVAKCFEAHTSKFSYYSIKYLALLLQMLVFIVFVFFYNRKVMIIFLHHLYIFVKI